MELRRASALPLSVARTAGSLAFAQNKGVVTEEACRGACPLVCVRAQLSVARLRVPQTLSNSSLPEQLGGRLPSGVRDVNKI